MIKTYERTMMIEDLSKATVTLYVYDKCKYSNSNLNEVEVTYKGVKSFSIVSGEDAAEIEKNSDGSCIDDYHEYLILNFADGESSTFRNSYVDMFIW